MLRCAGCDELVSEFAARCPICRRDTGDAVDLGPEPVLAQVDVRPGPHREETPYGADPTEGSGSERASYVPAGRRSGRVAVGIVIVAAMAILVMEVASPS